MVIVQDQEQTQFEDMPVLEARWLLVCAVVVLPLWIWPFDVMNAFATFSVSILKAMGWIIGVTVIVFLSSIAFSMIGKALLTSTSQQHEASGAQSHQ